MFSYAARTILSKTLRRILQKYLVDVNIDEVALGGDSGWGVVIKNVELREGAVLFSFPISQAHTTSNDSADSTKNKDNGARSKISVPKEKEEIDRKIDYIENMNVKDSKSNMTPRKSYEGKKRTHLQVNGEKYFNGKNTDDDVTKVPPPPPPQSPFWFYTRKANTEENKDSLRKATVESQNVQEKNSSLNEEKDTSSDIDDNGTNYSQEEAPLNQIVEFRVGRGGIIGNLGVRLVGSDLHIFVEDAFLILEVVTKKETMDVSAQKTTSTNSANDNGETAEKISKDNNTAELSAEQKLARTIASLPFISLSNIIVKIVFIEQNGTEGASEESKDDNESEDPTTYKKLTEQNHLIEIGVGSFTIIDEDEDESDSDNSTAKLDESENLISRMCSSKTPYATKANDPENFVHKRIKIGSENKNGVWINIYPPCNHPMRQASTPTDPLWARSIWESDDRPFMCISGFNFLARIFTGLLDKKDEGQESTSIYGEEYDIFTLDSTIGGYIDYMPMADEQPEKKEVPKKTLNMERGQSNFYRIAMGMRRSPCPSSSPHSDDKSCWAHGEAPNDLLPSDVTTMSDFIPAPGIVIFFSVYDPLELNVERQSLEALKKVMDIATQYNEQKSRFKESLDGSEIETHAGTQKEKDEKRSTPKKKKRGTDNDSPFPSYMDAENILVFGFHLNCIAIRTQIIKEETMKENGYSFSFCEFLVHSISMDCHLLQSDELKITDCDFDIGYVELNVFKGIDRKQHLIIGKNISVNKKLSAVPARGTSHTLMKSSTILNTSEYLDHRKGALQFRLIMSKKPKKLDTNEQKTFEIQLGTIRVDICSSLIQELKSVLSLSNAILFPAPSKPSTSSAPVALPKRFSWKYIVSLNGGVLTYDNAKCEFPSTRLVGEKSQTIGFVMESVLNQIELKFSSDYVGCVHGTGFFEKLADLPENVRMRTFLFLDDLTPLASILGIQNLPQNNFLGGYTINKHLRNIIEQITLKQAKEKLLVEKKKKRRKQLLTKIMLLCDDDLEDLVKNLDRKGKEEVH